VTRLELIRNFGILAHIDAGKTTVSERILFATGIEHRMGEVHDGTATMDWMAEERERGITIGAAVTHCPWKGYELPLIDTPGHVDFSAEVVRSLRVLDGAIVVLDAVAGVQAQTETVVRRAREQGLPLLLFVNKMDRLGADFARAVADAQAKLHPGVVQVQLPAWDGERFCGIIDLLSEQLVQWEPGSTEMAPMAVPIPEALRESTAAARESLCSTVAEGDEELENLFLESGDLPQETLLAALRRATLARRLVPAFAGSALQQIGVTALLDGVVSFLPSPLDREPLMVREAGSGREVELPPDPQAPPALLVFKLHHERHGELAFLRVFAGSIDEGDALLNCRTGERIRLQPLLRLHADHRERLASAGPGMLVAVQGVHGVRTGDTLCAPERQLLLAPLAFPDPVIAQTVEARDATRHDELEPLLDMLTLEDPTLSWSTDEDSGLHLLSGMGELHLEVALHRLERDFGLPVLASSPQVKLVETIRQAERAKGWLELPSEPPLRVDVELEIRPEEGEAPVLELAPGLKPLPPACLAALQAADALQGWPGPGGHALGYCRVILHSWKLDPPHLTLPPGALQGAMQNALWRGLQADMQLMEPRMRLIVRAPEETLSAVLADLQQRHAEIESLDQEEGWAKVHARVAMAHFLAYSTSLRSQTKGRGEFHLEPDGYMPRSIR